MRIFIGNLPFKISRKEIAKAFTKFGPIRSINIVKDRQTRQPKGFGFVEMAKEEDALSAIHTLNGTSLKGRSIRLEKARDRQAGGSPVPIERESTVQDASHSHSNSTGMISYVVIAIVLSVLVYMVWK
tara:strand:+ start:702 stop:1085 length:384 start_codon:yes stop_codon:yes gene_type:complete